jgi:hypothetical protein
MSDAFRHVIALLWRRLGLSRPSFQQDDVAVLVTDGIAITLALSADGRHILLSAKAGALSGSPLVRDQQAARLLKTNLHTLLSSRVCVCLDDQSSQTPAVMVRAVVPCETAFIDSLTEAISDIAHLAAEHGRELGGQFAGALGGPAAPLALPNEGLADDTLVFRL